MKPSRSKTAAPTTNLLVAGTATGMVKLVDLSKNKVIKVFQVADQNDNVFALDWNSLGMLAIGTSQRFTQVKKFEPET